MLSGALLAVGRLVRPILPEAIRGKVTEKVETGGRPVPRPGPATAPDPVGPWGQRSDDRPGPDQGRGSVVPNPQALPPLLRWKLQDDGRRRERIADAIAFGDDVGGNACVVVVDEIRGERSGFGHER